MSQHTAVTSPRATLTFVLTVAFFGAAFPAIRAAEVSFSPVSIVLLRALFASICLALVAMMLRVSLRMPLRDLALAAVIGQLGIAVYQMVVNIALTQTSVGVASTITNTAPLIAMILAAIWLRESIPLIRWIGVLVSLVGVYLLSTSEGTSSWAGIGLLSIAALCLGFYSVALKPLLARQHPLAVTFHGTWPGALLFIWVTPSTLEEAAVATINSWLAIGVLVVVVTCGGYVFLARLLQILPVSRVVLTYYLVPPVATVYAMLLYAEIPTWQETAGIAVVIAGVAIALSTPLKRKAHSPDSPLQRTPVE